MFMIKSIPIASLGCICFFWVYNNLKIIIIIIIIIIVIFNVVLHLLHKPCIPYLVIFMMSGNSSSSPASALPYKWHSKLDSTPITKNSSHLTVRTVTQQLKETYGPWVSHKPTTIPTSYSFPAPPLPHFIDLPFTPTELPTSKPSSLTILYPKVQTKVQVAKPPLQGALNP